MLSTWSPFPGSLFTSSRFGQFRGADCGLGRLPHLASLKPSQGDVRLCALKLSERRHEVFARLAAKGRRCLADQDDPEGMWRRHKSGTLQAFQFLNQRRPFDFQQVCGHPPVSSGVFQGPAEQSMFKLIHQRVEVNAIG